TKSPEVMATVQAQNVDYILINWWFEGAPGSIVHEYFYGWKDFPTDIMGYHDIEFFEQYGQTSKDLEIRPRLDSGISYCVPAGLNTFHLEGYYAEGYTKDSPVSAIYPPSGLLGQSGKYKTVSLDVPFEVQPLSSPVNQNLYADGTGPVQREISFSKIEQNTNNPDSSRMPAWVPITWLMSFKFDGSYTYYFDPLSNQDYKITGFYKAGIPADHWVINYSNRWEFDYNEDGQIKSGVMEYDSLGNLVAKYTASDYVVPSFLTIHNHFGDSPFMTVKNAQVETFGDPKEIYNIFDGSKKEGFYSYVASSISKSVTGFYNNNIPSGDWVVIYSGYKWVFKLDEEGNVLSGIKKYDSSDKLVAQYTSNKNVTPSFYAEFYDSNFALWPKTAYVETFSDAKDEKYYIEAGLKEGSYSSITPKGVTANGQYLHDQKTGVWSYYDPKRIPTDYTETY
ncbi:MAG: hypothetical protein JXR53_06470, partial [Bacteroidales bacterium]|nr:hypothetical protein [Bacteroidales bacterium]